MPKVRQMGIMHPLCKNRLDDLIGAWVDPKIKAVLCSRGGYGAVHLLPHIPHGLFRQNPKWLIGFSDISVLHAASFSQGVCSLHAPMARDFVVGKSDAESIMRILSAGELPRFELASKEEDNTIPQNICGKGKGRLIGGNFAVLDGLFGTPFDMLGRSLVEDCILFIEDIAEPIYKTERMLYRLYLQGVLEHIKGLIVGQFTETCANSNHRSTEEMISRFLAEHSLNHYPVVYGFPVGHVDNNPPQVIGSMAELEVTPDKVILIEH